MKTKLKFIKNVIYRMKRSYGLPIDYMKLVEHQTDPVTGIKTISQEKIHIRNAIVLRAREFRSFVYDLAFISANKDFTTGGFFDPEDRRLIIDANDVPVNFVPNVDDCVIFQNRKYEVKEIFHFEENYAYMMLMRRVRGAPIVRLEANLSVMDLQQNVEYEIQPKLERTVTSVLILTQEIKEVT